MISRTLLTFTLASAVVLSACDGDSSGDPNGDPPLGPPRGTPECQRWQQAICDWAVRCTDVGRYACLENAITVSCVSDSEASRCADELAGASCVYPPSGCDIADIADPAPAQAGCREFVSAGCAWEESCSGAPASQCEIDAMNSVPCDSALGLAPSFEQCIMDFPNHPCDATGVPNSCKGVIKLTM